MDDAITGMQACFQMLSKEVVDKYHVSLKRIGVIGISGMMHGYLPYD